MAPFHSFLLILVLITHYGHSQSTSSPTNGPTNEPTLEPTSIPTIEPTHLPTTQPTVEPTSTLISPSTSATLIQSPSHHAKTFIQLYLLYIIIAAAVILCICLIVLAFIIRNHLSHKLQNELHSTNQAIKSEEQRPINSPHTGHNELNQSQMQQLQQLQQMQQYNTNFQKQHNIAAYNALQFAPPINHDGNTWKQLNHVNPQQRMLQLMHQQQYIQQMANQAAVAMAYFIEQQMGNNSGHHRNMSNTSVVNSGNNHSNKVDSLSFNSNANMQSPPVQVLSGNTLMDPSAMMKPRLDTMDDAAFGSDDLPPSVVNGENVLNGEDNGEFEFDNIGGEVLNENEKEQNVPLVNVPEHNLNNARKIESLPHEIPDLPFGVESYEYGD